MQFQVNDSKNVTIQVGDRYFARNAIQTHFVQIGENYIDLVKRYVAPLYQEGDILSISEKIVALCQKRVVYKKDMRLSWLARFLSKFAMHSEAGIGVDSPWKMQFGPEGHLGGDLRRRGQALRQARHFLRHGGPGDHRPGRFL